ncbi:MAG: hypothetical protein RLZZ440_43, partial [Planctomycetota bacterium]
LEIKTSGRYTYEMGRALAGSADSADQALWRDWYRFTLDLASAGAFSEQATEQKLAREFIEASFATAAVVPPADLFASPDRCRSALETLTASPDLMFWFEYNFLFVLAAEGRAEKAALGDHSPAGYRQRERFYAISEEGRLRFAQNVARYLVFLADTTGLVSAETCQRALARLDGYTRYQALLDDIAAPGA